MNYSLGYFDKFPPFYSPLIHRGDEQITITHGLLTMNAISTNLSLSVIIICITGLVGTLSDVMLLWKRRFSHIMKHESKMKQS
jgi:hypothetical protein